MESTQALARALSWERTGDAEVPWRVEVDGTAWRIRVNDFPAEALYSLLIDDAEVLDFDDWPDAWARNFHET